jgi:hypothetical protein
MAIDRETELIFEVAERHAISTLEVVRMVRLAMYGPFGARMFEECGMYWPGDDEHFDALRTAKRIAEHPPIEELVEIYWYYHDICLWHCEHEPDLAKRAAMFAALHEAEKVMEASREWARKELERRKREEIE